MFAATTGGERDEMGTTGVLRRKLKRQEDGRGETIDDAAAAAVEPGGTKVCFRSGSISLSALLVLVIGALLLVVEATTGHNKDPMVLGYITTQFSSFDFFFCSSTAEELIVALLLS
jgi:hypothetical protein